MRAALYVRFGAPGRVSFLPVGVNDEYRIHTAEVYWTDPRTGERREVTQHMVLPMNVQVWEYPELGMTVEIRDMELSQAYEMPRSDSMRVDARADTAVVEQHGLVSAGAGRAVFSPLLPGVHRIEVAGRVSRFAGESGAHLLAQFEMPGTPLDTLLAECVILDSSGSRVASATARPDPSRCEPATRRTMEFAFDLPTGRYRMAFAVNDSKGGRGLARAVVVVPVAIRGLALSDVVPVCGPYDVGAGNAPVRLAPNVGSDYTKASRLHAYFEVYGLATDPSGFSRFDLAYEVHALSGDPRPWYRRLGSGRPPARLAVTTEESSPGPLRRQFIQMPLESLPAGEYRIEVRVHDRLARTTVARTLEFVK